MSSKPGTAGTQEPGVTMHFSGTRAASASSSSSASMPATFIASCGSHAIAEVPCGTTARAYSAGPTIADSTWTWASMKAGAR